VWQQWKGAWQSKTLTGAPIAVKGKLSVPGPWQHAELWTP